MLANEAANESPSSPGRALFEGARRYFQNIGHLRVAGLRSSLDPYQKVDVEIATRRNAFLIASEMGTGKSIESIAFALRKKAQKILIISTKSGVHSTWTRELEKHLEPSTAGKRRILSSKGLSTPEGLRHLKEAKWVLATHTTATKNIGALRNMGFDLVIIDECHKVNHQNSEQSQALLSLNPRLKLAVSGSPFKNKRLELYPVLNWLFPDEFPSQRDFFESFCMTSTGIFSLQHELRTKMICRFQDQVLTLPPVEHYTEAVVLNEEERAEYSSRERDFVGWLTTQQGFDEQSLATSVTMHKLHGLRRAAIGPKIPRAEEIVRAERANGHKVVIYTTYMDSAAEMARRLQDMDPFVLVGSSTNEDRARMVQDFTNQTSRGVFIISAAGGESIDLTAASAFVFLNDPLTYADKDQVLKRVVRRGQISEVRAYHLQSLDTIDDRIAMLLMGKKEEYDRLVRIDRNLGRWYEESEKENLGSLVKEMLLARGGDSTAGSL